MPPESRNNPSESTEKNKQKESIGSLRNEVMATTQANGIISKDDSGNKLPFLVDKEGNVKGKNTGKIYATVDLPTFSQLGNQGYYTIFSDKNGAYIRSDYRHYTFSKVKESGGDTYFPIKGENNFLASGGNLYLINDEDVDIKKVDLGPLKFTKQSKILAYSEGYSGGPDGRTDVSIDAISMNGKNIMVIQSDGKYKELPFNTAQVKTKKITWEFLETGGSGVAANLLLIDHNGKKAVYDLGNQKYSSIDQYIDQYMQNQANESEQSDRDTVKKLLLKFILDPNKAVYVR